MWKWSIWLIIWYLVLSLYEEFWQKERKWAWRSRLSSKIRPEYNIFDKSVEFELDWLGKKLVLFYSLEMVHFGGEYEGLKVTTIAHKTTPTLTGKGMWMGINKWPSFSLICWFCQFAPLTLLCGVIHTKARVICGFETISNVKWRNRSTTSIFYPKTIGREIASNKL